MSRVRYDRQIATVRDDLLRLGSMVEHALLRSVKCLESWDTAVAAQIINDDKAIDRETIAVEAAVVRLLALQQPVVATDLRFMAAVISIAGELERIGDYANSIARRVQRATRRPSLVTPPAKLSEMAGLAMRMLHASLDAMLRQDVDLAHSLGALDEQVDELESQLRDELVALAKSDPLKVEAAIDMLEVVHALERSADRATNIAERVIYLVTADIESIN